MVGLLTAAALRGLPNLDCRCSGRLRIGATLKVHQLTLPITFVSKRSCDYWGTFHHSPWYDAQRDVLDEKPLCLFLDQVTLAFLSIVNVFDRRV